MSDNAEIRSKNYYFADAIVGANEYHGVDISKPLEANNMIKKASVLPMVTLLTKEGEIAHINWDGDVHGISNDEPTIYYDAVDKIVSVKIKAHAVGTYHLKFYVTTEYDDTSTREERLAYDIYFDVV